MSYGLKGKVKQIVMELDAMRNQSGQARDITLRRYLAENFQTSSGAPLEPGHLFAELEIDPRRTQVQDLMNDNDNRYLLPEIIRSGIRRGLGMAAREELEAYRRVVSQGPILSE